jgi:hypothetical protein
VLVAVLGAGPAGLSSPRGASADAFEEREQQLKSLGIDDDLRPRIHRAIGVGAHWLAGVVAPDAGKSPKASPAFVDPGPTVLATLALAHARTPDSVPAARTAVHRLLVEDRASAETIRANTYMAGIAGLLAADPAMEVPPSVSREIALRLAAAQGAYGWWGYRLDAPISAAARERGVPAPARMGPPNLSTTQFAVLGAFGLGRAGAPVSIDVWRRHARGLCDTQTQDGSWPYSSAKTERGYTNGTFMGIAGVLVAQDALRDRVRDTDLLRDLAATKARGMKALRHEVAMFIRSSKSLLEHRPKGKFARVPGAIPVNGYSMYALEKACIFAGLEKVDEQSWYEAGARLLVAAQGDDGMWVDINTTSFALLFLSRSPDRCRPTTVTETPTRPPPETTVTETPTKSPPPPTTGR